MRRVGALAAAALPLLGPAPPAGAQTADPLIQEVDADWPLIPARLKSGGRGIDGRQFRLLFVTSGSRDGTSGDISVYNDFVRAAILRGHADIRYYAGHFYAVASTSSVDARDNTNTNVSVRGDVDSDTDDANGLDRDAPIYWLGATGGSNDIVAREHPDATPINDSTHASFRTFLREAARWCNYRDIVRRHVDGTEAQGGFSAYCSFYNADDPNFNSDPGRFRSEYRNRFGWENHNDTRDESGRPINLGQKFVFTGSNKHGVKDKPLGGGSTVGASQVQNNIQNTLRSGTARNTESLQFLGLSRVFRITDQAVDLTASSTTVNEGGTLTITATLEHNALQNLTIPLRIVTGDTTAGGQDYSLAPSIQIMAGQTVGSTVLTAMADAIDEPREQVSVELDRGMLRALRDRSRPVAPGSRPRVDITLIDVNSTKVQIASSDPSAEEGNTQDPLSVQVRIGTEVDDGLVPRGLGEGEQLEVDIDLHEIEPLRGIGLT